MRTLQAKSREHMRKHMKSTNVTLHKCMGEQSIIHKHSPSFFLRGWACYCHSCPRRDHCPRGPPTCYLLGVRPTGADTGTELCLHEDRGPEGVVSHAGVATGTELCLARVSPVLGSTQAQNCFSMRTGVLRGVFPAGVDIGTELRSH